MGFLRMIGLVTAEEHAKVEAKLKTALTDLANEVEARELVQRTLNNAQTETTRLARGWDKCGDELKAAKSERDKLSERLKAADAEVVAKGKTIFGLEAQLEAAEQVIADLKPDAEAMRRRRANDANRVRPSRSKKTDASTSEVKTAPATGKPRTAIPAKVGKQASAKVSGDRPAKKAVRK